VYLSRPGPCFGEGALEGCGQACGGSNPFCAAGLYCNADDACAAECIAGQFGWCAEGEVCTFNGRCTPEGQANACSEVKLDIRAEAPSVSLLIDRSGSMSLRLQDNQPPQQTTNDPSRWNLIQDFLVGSADETSGGKSAGLIYSLQNEVKFSFVTYTGTWAENDEGEIFPVDCPLLDWPKNNKTPIKQPLLGAYNRIAQFYRSLSPFAGTPTAPAIEHATDALVTSNKSATKILVLATDGEPESCDAPVLANDSDAVYANKRAIARANVIEAVERAQQSGVLTYVLGVGPETSQTHLDELATAGHGQAWRITAQTIDPERSSLNDAFKKIIYPHVSCIVEISARVITEKACSGSLKLNGADTPLQCNDPNGWALLPDGKRLELKGKACEEFKRPLFDQDPKSTPKVEANFPCTSLETS